MSIETCPNEILIMIFSQVPVEDLPACMAASSRLRSFIEATFLVESSRLCRISEINVDFLELLVYMRGNGT